MSSNDELAYAPTQIDGREVYTEVTWLRVVQQAPPPPPCFEGRRQWLEWLALAHSASSGHGGTKPFMNGGFNERLNFCVDCTGAYRARMDEEGRCRPRWLAAREHEAPSPEAQALELSRRGRQNRRRGAEAERELFKLLSAALGIEVKRALGQSRDGGADADGVFGVAIECKSVRQKARPTWWRQAAAAAALDARVPVVFFRERRKPGELPTASWRGIVPADLVPVHDIDPAASVAGARPGLEVSFEHAMAVIKEAAAAALAHEQAQEVQAA